MDAGLAVPRSEPFLPTTRARNVPRAWLSAVYLVPLGDLRYIDMEALAAYYQQKFGLQVQTFPGVALDNASYNPERQQYVGDRLLDLLVRNLPRALNTDRTLVIGVTEADMYITQENWNYAYGLRDRSGRAAVISTARMEVNLLYGLPVDLHNLHRNLAKMMSRDLGFLYYNLPGSEDPRSVLRPSILGLDDLYATGEEF